MSILKGIDVSNHQGNINWSAVKNEVDFAIVRAGFGRLVTQKDEQFENNYTGCKSNGIPCGAYWYSYAMSADEAIEEAKVCLEVIKGKTFEYPIYFDIEENKQLALGKQKCTEIARAFLQTVENAGYWVGIYSSKSHLENYIDGDVKKRYAVWVAHYGVNKTTYNGQFGMWQKSSEGAINGIKGNVDVNECYFDYMSAIKNAGRNGFVKPTTSATVASFKKGDKVSIKNGACDYKGGRLASWVYRDKFDVISVSDDRVVIGKGKAITAAIYVNNLIKK